MRTAQAPANSKKTALRATHVVCSISAFTEIIAEKGIKTYVRTLIN